MIVLDVDRQTMDWIISYLSNCKIRVTLGGTSSGKVAVQYGVPQVAVLSPTLFNIMLNDFPYDENVLISYANDVTTYLDSLFEWFSNWHFTLSPTKCSLQLSTRRRNYKQFSLK